uniref:Mitochondrial carrier protein n=1 Tax=Glossina austeni TaxID=7395 RepID=A0A1A9UXQ7_GLOAU
MPAYAKFVTGGLAGACSALLVQPMELVKNRLQMSGAGGIQKDYRNTWDVVRKVYKYEGVLRFYNGLGASIVRQLMYTTTRLGIYQYYFDTYKRANGCVPSLLTCAGYGLIAGAAGALVGTPADVVLVRTVTDGNMPVHLRRNYKNIFDALIRIGREEGLAGLWSGCLPTTARAMVKRYTLNEGLFLHACTGFVSGLITTIVSMPLDMAKTRLQTMERPAHFHERQYKHTLDVIMQTRDDSMGSDSSLQFNQLLKIHGWRQLLRSKCRESWKYFYDDALNRIFSFVAEISLIRLALSFAIPVTRLPMLCECNMEFKSIHYFRRLSRIDYVSTLVFLIYSIIACKKFTFIITQAHLHTHMLNIIARVKR